MGGCNGKDNGANIKKYGGGGGHSNMENILWQYGKYIGIVWKGYGGEYGNMYGG